jgi:hypothetical protein
MSRHPTPPDSLKAALAAAERLRASDSDPGGVAHWLLRTHSRCESLESLLVVVDRYLQFGMPEHELSEMRRLVDRLRERDSPDGHGDEAGRTLPL